MRFMQEMFHKVVVVGYRFGDKGVPQVIYADDGAFLAEDIAGIEMEMDLVLVVTHSCQG